MARLFSWKPALSFRGRESRGLRGWAGKPLHPPLTDFPVASYILVGAFDLVSFLSGDHSRVGTDFFRAGTYVIIAGAVVSLGTALTGFWDWLKGVPRHTQAWRTANVHMAVMLTVTAIVVVDIVVRLSKWSEGYAELPLLILSLAAAGLVGLGAIYGGTLVYDYGFNVEPTVDSPAWDRSEVDADPGYKREAPAQQRRR